MIVQAHAKINVSLAITGKREDGYHSLDMVMVPLDLHDSIDISLLPEAFDTYITCDDVSLETGEYNLCTIALKALRDFYKFKQQFRIHIHKSIPMSAGLGGGSSDAAALIHGVLALLKIHPQPEDIQAIALKIGSDVPFCFKGVPARVGGTGEIVEPINIEKKYNVLIVKPTQGLSTTTVYKQYDLMDHEELDVSSVVEALAEGNDDKLSVSMSNALEKPAIFLCPEIAKIKSSLKDDGFKLVLMSGSGSSVFALSDSQRKVEKAEAKYSKLGYLAISTSILNPGKK